MKTLRDKLEKAKSIGSQKPSEPAEGLCCKKRFKDVRPRWLTDEEPSKKYQKASWLWCGKSGHRAANCNDMWDRVKQIGAAVPPPDDVIHYIGQIFCESCFRYYKDQGEGAGAETEIPRMIEPYHRALLEPKVHGS